MKDAQFALLKIHFGRGGDLIIGIEVPEVLAMLKSSNTFLKMSKSPACTARCGSVGRKSFCHSVFGLYMVRISISPISVVPRRDN